MKVVAKNRRALYDYEVLDTLEAGIILSGQETKSCRMGNISLSGAYVSLLDNTPVLKHASIAKYRYASGLQDYDPGQDRKLLLRKRELQKLQTHLAEKGATLIPIEVRAGKRIKVILALGKGLKRMDKRQKIKEKDIKRRMRRGEDN